MASQAFPSPPTPGSETPFSPTVFEDEQTALVPLAALHEREQRTSENAVKYSPAGSRVVIGVECRQGESQALEAVVWVQDEGHGIRPQDQEAVFDLFYRARTQQ